MKLLGFIQDAMPLRLKEVHMVKQPYVFKLVWSMFTPFIQEKLKNRVRLFSFRFWVAKLQIYMIADFLPWFQNGIIA